MFVVSVQTSHARQKDTSAIYTAPQLRVGFGYPTGLLLQGVYIEQKTRYQIKSGSWAWHCSYTVRKKRYGVSLCADFESDEGIWNNYVTYKVRGRNRYYYDPQGHFKLTDISGMAEFRFYYGHFMKGIIEMYGAVGVGIGYRDQTNTYDSSYYNQHFVGGVNTLGNQISTHSTPIDLAFYFAPFNFEAGKRYTIYNEVGIGNKGVLVFGVGYRFGVK